MSDEFDPYLKWLGIRESDRPPNSYQLLGLEPFESDREVISNAADRQMAHVRTFQAGRHSALSQRVLNELASARINLLNAEKKRAYDAQLRAAEQAKRQATAANQSMASAFGSSPDVAVFEPPEVASPPGQMDLSGGSFAPPAPRRRSSGTRINTVSLTVSLVVVAAVLAGVAILIVADQWGSSPNVASEGLTSSTVGTTSPPPPSKQESTTKRDNATNGTDSEQSAPIEEVRPRPDDNPDKSAEAAVEVKAESGLDSSDSAPPPTTRADPQPEYPPLQPAVPAKNTDPLPTDANTTTSTTAGQPASPPIADSRLKVPPDDEVRGAQKLIDELFGQEIKEATTPEAKGRVAAKLLEQATKTSDDSAARFRLFELARELALSGENWSTANTAIDQAAVLYQTDPLNLKAETLAEFAKSRSTTLDRDLLAQAALATIDQALARDDYETAKKIAGSARKLSKNSPLTQLKEQVDDVSDAIARYDREFRAIKSGAETLKNDPQDKAAATSVGRFRCFVRGDWHAGLPLLARGDDSNLAQMSAADLANPKDAEARVALADQWWEVANGLPTPQKLQVQIRAGNWYSQAKNDLSGIAQTKVEKRLSEIAAKRESAARASGKARVGKARPARIYACVDDNFTLAVNGKQVLEGGLGQLREVDYEFHPGDIITVRAIDIGGTHGFSCIVKFTDSGDGIVTATGGVWQEYDPQSTVDWGNVKGITQIRPVSQGHPGAAKYTGEAAKMQAGSIWGSKNTCYLAVEIPK